MLDAVALPPSYEMPGNKQNSVGHRAKAAVVAARDAGLDLPKNAQGFAASAIAKGADSASVFQSLIVSDDPPVSDEVPTDVIVDLVPPDDPAPVPGNVGEIDHQCEIEVPARGVRVSDLGCHDATVRLRCLRSPAHHRRDRPHAA